MINIFSVDFLVPHDKNKLEHIWGDTFEQPSDPGTERKSCSLSLVAGVQGHIYVIDLKTRMLCNVSFTEEHDSFAKKKQISETPKLWRRLQSDCWSID
ncbi:hypothetical protein B9Z55_008878 [Caenorhabditis nigoni]|uniref:Uncharacterized protein n=1 Tax=Caenorhabditis nigoni TaxID=1611254 RepID=A0A2G5UPI8_9PELO|nr:hypothetical protein B9Z55_008878 [Caenorhabditis nigoni]